MRTPNCVGSNKVGYRRHFPSIPSRGPNLDVGFLVILLVQSIYDRNKGFKQELVLFKESYVDAPCGQVLF